MVKSGCYRTSVAKLRYYQTFICWLYFCSKHVPFIYITLLLRTQKVFLYSQVGKDGKLNQKIFEFQSSVKIFCSVHKMIANIEHKDHSFSNKYCCLLILRQKFIQNVVISYLLIKKVYFYCCRNTSSLSLRKSGWSGKCKKDPQRMPRLGEQNLGSEFALVLVKNVIFWKSGKTQD